MLFSFFQQLSREWLRNSSLIFTRRFSFLAHDELRDKLDHENKHKAHQKKFLERALSLTTRENYAEKADYYDEGNDNL